MKLKRNISNSPFAKHISYATGNLYGMSEAHYRALSKLITGIENGNGKKRLRVYIGKHAPDGTYSTVKWYLDRYFSNYINDYEQYLSFGYFTIICANESNRNALKAILTDIYESNLIEKPSDYTSTNSGGDNPPPTNGGGDNPPPTNGGGNNPPPTNIGSDNGSQQKNDNTMILILGVAVIAVVLIIVLKKKGK
jgi:hypothetical protein